jgi:hypothetical protein
MSGQTIDMDDERAEQMWDEVSRILYQISHTVHEAGWAAGDRDAGALLDVVRTIREMVEELEGWAKEAVD